jgi:hypothetical protein
VKIKFHRFVERTHRSTSLQAACQFLPSFYTNFLFY